MIVLILLLALAYIFRKGLWPAVKGYWRALMWIRQSAGDLSYDRDVRRQQQLTKLQLKAARRRCR